MSRWAPGYAAADGRGADQDTGWHLQGRRRCRPISRPFWGPGGSCQQSMGRMQERPRRLMRCLDFCQLIWAGTTAWTWRPSHRSLQVAAMLPAVLIVQRPAATSQQGQAPVERMCENMWEAALQADCLAGADEPSVGVQASTHPGVRQDALSQASPAPRNSPGTVRLWGDVLGQPQMLHLQVILGLIPKLLHGTAHILSRLMARAVHFQCMWILRLPRQ